MDTVASQLAKVLTALEGVKAAFDGAATGGKTVSLADLIVLGGVAAVFAIGAAACVAVVKQTASAAALSKRVIVIVVLLWVVGGRGRAPRRARGTWPEPAVARSWAAPWDNGMGGAVPG